MLTSLKLSAFLNALLTVTLFALIIAKSDSGISVTNSTSTTPPAGAHTKNRLTEDENKTDKKWINFINHELGYSLQYPASFEISDRHGTLPAITATGKVFLCPGCWDDRYVTIGNLQANEFMHIDLIDYHTEATDIEDYMTSEQSQLLESPRLHEKTIIGGLDAYHSIFTSKKDGREGEHIFLIHEGKVISIYIGSSNAVKPKKLQDFTSYQTFKKILSTIEFHPAGSR